MTVVFDKQARVLLLLTKALQFLRHSPHPQERTDCGSVSEPAQTANNDMEMPVAMGMRNLCLECVRLLLQC